MPIPPTIPWQLRIVRAFLARTAPKVSLGFFWWWKSPGNAYTTFYPTAWLPDPEDRVARADPALGQSFFERLVTPGGPRCKYTLGEYGDGKLWLPAWSTKGKQTERPVCDFAEDHDVDAAARRLRAKLDVASLARFGGPDPHTSAVVDAWLAKLIAMAERPDIDSIQMDFDDNALPMALWMMEFYEPATNLHHDVWWEDRVLQHAY